MLGDQVREGDPLWTGLGRYDRPNILVASSYYISFGLPQSGKFALAPGLRMNMKAKKGGKRVNKECRGEISFLLQLQ